MGFASFDGPDFKFGAPVAGVSIREQLASWAQEASASGRAACVYLTASWCPPSVQLEKSLSNPLMASALRGVNFVTYDVDDALPALTEAGFPAHTVPVFYLLNPDGTRAGPSINGGAWGSNTPENMAPPLAAFFDQTRRTVPVPAAAPVSAVQVGAAQPGGLSPRAWMLIIAAVALAVAVAAGLR